jgi:S-(hydroxymethyl)glutathione dehydrogenase/alcohol dehydrogenase
MEEEASFPLGRLAQSRVRLLPAYGQAVKNYMPQIITMLSKGVLDPSPLVSHTLAIEEAPRAYELLDRRDDGVLRVLLRV